MAPAAGSVAAVPTRGARRAHHRRLRPGRPLGRSPAVRNAAELLPRRVRGDSRLRVAGDGGPQLLPNRPPPDAPRDVVGRPSLHLPRARTVVLASTGDGRFVRHSPGRARVVDVLWLATAGTVLAYRIGLPLWRSARHSLRVVGVQHESPGVVSLVCEGRALDRLASPAGSSCSGASSRRACGGRRTPTHCRRSRPRHICASRSRTSGTTAQRCRGCDPGPASRSRVPTGRSPGTRAPATGSCSWAPASGSPRSGRCSRTSRATSRPT